MLVAGMAAGGTADQLNLYLNPAMPEGFEAAVTGPGGSGPTADLAAERSASLDQPVSQ